jgi:hypothetical protein
MKRILAIGISVVLMNVGGLCLVVSQIYSK